MSTPGGRYDFDDGGSYCGGWEAGKAHGHGVCTGPKGQGEYSGAWANGFEASGVYLWPSGNSFEGLWQQGRRHGLGVEKKDKWTYQGEWAQGFKGRYGVRLSNATGAKYEGTWANGLQDGYGCETYADGGTYHGQWQRGTRHGYGVRQSVPYGVAAHHQATKGIHSSQQSLQHSDEEEEDKVVLARDKKLNETRGGFILTSKSDASASQQLTEQRGSSSSRLVALFEKPARSMKRSLKAAGAKLRKQRSANDVSSGDNSSLRSGKLSSSMRSTRSFASQKSTTSSIASTSASKASLDDDRSFYSQDDITDASVTERYSGEWNGDKRCGFGVSERSDGLRYEGEWYNNRKHGYGTTTRKDGSREDGKYKNNVLVSSTSAAKARLLIMQRNKLTERVTASVEAARRAAQLALQKAEVAVSRMANARSKAELAVAAGEKAQQDSVRARSIASQLDPKFHQPGVAILKKKQQDGSQTAGTPDAPRARAAAGIGGLSSRTALQQSNGAPDGRLNGMPSGSGASSPEAMMSKPVLLSGRSPLPSSPEASRDFWHDQPSAQTAATVGKLNVAVNQAMLVDHFDHYETLARIPASSGNGGTAAVAAEHQQRPKQTASSLPDRPGSSRGAAENGDDNIITATAVPALQSLLVPASDPGSVPGSRLPRSQSGGGVTFALGGLPAAQVPKYTDRLMHKVVGRPGSSPAPPPSLAHRSKDDALLLSSRAAAVRSNSPLKANGAEPASGALASGKVNVGMATLSSSRKQRGSLPDVSIIRDMSALSKEEVQKLSAERREEIRKLLDEHERRRQGDISILLGDVKKWLDQRKLIMLVLAINIGVISFLLKWWL